MRENIYKLLAATAQTMGQNLSVDAARMMADDLEKYDEESIASSLKLLRRRGGRFCLSSIIDNISAQDGRPSPDLAWAMFPKNEDVSAVITQEMADAWHVASEQYYSDDIIGAQIAFKREYSKIVESSRGVDAPVKWFPSLGRDPSQRADALAEAVRCRRLTVSHAIKLIDGDGDGVREIVYVAVGSGVINRQEVAKLLPVPDSERMKCLAGGSVRKIQTSITGDEASA